MLLLASETERSYTAIYEKPYLRDEGGDSCLAC